VEEEPYSLATIAKFLHLPTKEFEKQYKDHLSGFHDWNQKDHAEDWLLFSKNIGTHLSIDETSISNGELYTVLTNKAAKGGKGSLVATVEGTKSKEILAVLSKIFLKERLGVKEITLDFSSSMESAARMAFPNAKIVTDRFHVQKLVSEALQEMRVKLRWEAIEEENKLVKKAKEEGKYYYPKTYSNGDTKKQLLARSRYLLFRPKSKWTDRQKERSVILFKEYPDIKKGYELSMMFRNYYESSQTKKDARERLNKWYKKVEEKDFGAFITAAEYIRNHEETVLNYFTNRSTNASAESFNAKIKGFRALVRGVRDKKFFLFRVAKIYG